MNPVLIVILQKIAGKLLERSSVTAYLVAILAAFGVKDAGVGEQIAGYLATAGSVVLFVLNDATLGKWIRGKAISPKADVIEPKPITVPEPLSPTAAEAAPPEVPPMSITTVASALLAKLQAVAALLPILTSLVQTVEASLPAGTPGAAKLKAVEDALASVYAKEQIASASFAEVWPFLAGVASSLVATFKAAGVFTSSKVVSASSDGSVAVPSPPVPPAI